MSSHDLDPANYIRRPVLDTAGAITLGIALLTAYREVGPQSLPGPVQRAARALRKHTKNLQHSWDGQRQAQASDEDRRPADQRVDRAFAAVFMRLEALSLLPPSVDEAGRAAVVQARLFPQGLSFLKLPYNRQWAQCDQRIRDMTDGALLDELRELVGDVVLKELRAAHANYGRALGITEANTIPIVPKLAEPLAATLDAVVDYAIQLVAAGKNDADLGPAVRACLQPLDALQSATGRRLRRESDEPVIVGDPSAEIPTVEGEASHEG